MNFRDFNITKVLRGSAHSAPCGIRGRTFLAPHTFLCGQCRIGFPGEIPQDSLPFASSHRGKFQSGKMTAATWLYINIVNFAACFFFYYYHFDPLPTFPVSVCELNQLTWWMELFISFRKQRCKWISGLFNAAGLAAKRQNELSLVFFDRIEKWSISAAGTIFFLICI